MQMHYHVRVTLDSSTIERAKELAKSERRSIGNYVAALIEKAAQQKEPADEPR